MFRGGFSLEAAEGVIDLSAFPDAPLAMDAVQMLREKSFLASRETPFGVRYHMFRAMREFGESSLRLGEEVVARHAAHFAQEAKAWESQRVGPRMAEALDRLDLMRENVLAAIERTLALGRIESAAELALAISGLLLARGTGRQRVAVPEAVLAAARAAPGRVGAEAELRLGAALARAYESMGQYQQAEAAAEAAVTRAEADGVGPGRAMAEGLTALAEARRQSGRLDEAVTLHDRAEAIYAGLRDELGLARNLGARAMIQITRGDRAGALSSLSRAEKINRAAHNAVGLIANLSNHARVLRDAGDIAGAVARLEEAERLCRAIGDAGTCARVIGNKANTLTAGGDVEGASRAHAAAESLFLDLGDRTNAARVAMNRGEVLLRQGRFDEALATLDRVKPVMEELGQKRSVAVLLAGRARALLGLGRAAEALADAEASLAAFGTMGAAGSAEALVSHEAKARALEATKGADDPATRDAAAAAVRAADALGGGARASTGGVDLDRLRRLAGG
ncbi:MAG: tetratricopeptide repeat protein [Phycisphaerae bacterium]|nr:tetratricopeptide repeat protein [Phycisphaerae bacterium]